MEFWISAHTDVGTRKSINQDSICARIADINGGKIAMAVVCDGMGGLAKSEEASAAVASAFLHWFENELPGLYPEFGIGDILIQWNNLILQQNISIARYGAGINLHLGTTLTAVLIVNDSYYLVAQVGDSAAFLFDSTGIRRLTEDQTVAGQELKNGFLTEEQARKDSGKSVLLQCVGFSETLHPQFIQGKPSKNSAFLLCTDGFYRVFQEQELRDVLGAANIEDGISSQAVLQQMTDIAKERGETDNISALYIELI